MGQFLSSKRAKFLLLPPIFAALALTTGTSLAQHYWDDYLPFANKWGVKRSSTGPGITGQWAAWSNNGVETRVWWNSSSLENQFDWNAVTNAERFEIRTNCGSGFVYLNGYEDWRNGSAVGTTNWIRTKSASVTVGGVKYDLTAQTNTNTACRKIVSNVNGTGTSSVVGMPYVNYVLWDQPYVYEVYGELSGPAASWTREFYWKAKIEPKPAVLNSCWVGAGASTRKAMKLTEAYWDEVIGWTTGNGTVSGSNGNYSFSGVTYGRTDYLGKDAGPSWVHIPGQCLKVVHSY